MAPLTEVTSHAGHTVQFYEDEGFLERQVTDFLAGAVTGGEAAVLIATPPHRQRFLDSLLRNAVNVQAAERQGALTCLDARETLDQFMSGVLPDPGKFEQTIGAVMERAARGRRPIRAYGEMVDVLWKEGNYEGAIRLEELWNDLSTRRSFSLLCAYSMSNFGDHAHAEGFRRICAQHGHVLPAEASRSAGETVSTSEIAFLQQQAYSLQREIARREALEAELREALDRSRRAEHDLQDFVDNAVEGLHWVGPDGKVIWANQAELDLLGYTKEEYIGRCIGDFHADANATADILGRLSRNETLRDYEIQLRCKDGTLKTVLIHSNVRWENGQFLHSRCFTRDITHRKQLEAERESLLDRERAARLEADTSNRVKDEFLALLSHELRTPLNAIVGWTQLAAAAQTDTNAEAAGRAMRRALDVIERNAATQARLIDDLLDVSRIVSGKLELTCEAVELTGLLRSVADSVRPSAAAKRLGFDVRIPATEMWVSGDATRLQQIVWNLLSNAVKFTPADGLIELELDGADDRARIVVRDTGQGIGADFIPHVFERFRQGDTTTSRRHGGLGIGLAVVRSLVEAQGGTVTVKSPGKDFGATFTVHLPLSTTFQSRKPASSAGPLLDGIEGVRLLIVDDDLDSREALRHILRQRGALVTIAASAGEAMSHLLTRPFDVLLGDLGMPAEDGYALITALRNHARADIRQIKAVAITGYTGETARQRAFTAGYDGYVNKPVPLDRLIHIVSGLLATSQTKSAPASGRVMQEPNEDGAQS